MEQEREEFIRVTMVNNMMRTHHGVGGGRLILILGTFLLLVTQGKGNHGCFTSYIFLYNFHAG